MVFENFGVLNRVRVRKVWWHVPIEIKVQYPSPRGIKLFEDFSISSSVFNFHSYFFNLKYGLVDAVNSYHAILKIARMLMITKY